MSKRWFACPKKCKSYRSGRRVRRRRRADFVKGSKRECRRTETEKENNLQRYTTVCWRKLRFQSSYGTETFWNHIQPFKVEEKIFGFFIYISKIFIGRVYETTIFCLCKTCTLVCKLWFLYANSRFCVQTCILSIIFCRFCGARCFRELLQRRSRTKMYVFSVSLNF